jgi:hypothetical protein
MAEVQIAIVDHQNTQIALAAPEETQVNIAVPGIQGAQGTQGIQGPTGQGVPSGGTTGQLLAKASNTDYDTEWVIANPLPLPSFTQVDLTYSGNTIIAASYPSGVPYDYASFTYSGNTLTQLDYRQGGSGGTLIASYELVYSGSTLISVIEL